MKTAAIPLLLGAGLLAFAQQEDPSKTLYDTGVRDEQSGRLDRAKLTLLTLASTYYDSPLAAKAKVEIGAIYILRRRRRGGVRQSRAAYDTFGMVMRVYPESPLAKLASTEMRNLDPAGKWKR